MKIVLIGSGNVASILGVKLKELQHQILQVYSRQIQNAELLADQLHAEATADLGSISAEADFYLICVSDTAIKDVANDFPFTLSDDQYVAHTCGSVKTSVLSATGKNYGVLYPPQTFSKGRNISLGDVPFCVTASTPETEYFLKTLGDDLGRAVRMNDEQREKLHVAAIMVCNFTNHLIDLADEYLEEEDMSIDLLMPLIKETILKGEDIGAHEAQTGPARRGDQEIIEKHLNLLGKNKKLKKLYKVLSKSIQKHYKN